MTNPINGQTYQNISWGVLVGLFQNWEARTKWLILAPKLKELRDEFEQNLENYDPFVGDVVEHHESVAFPRSFYQKTMCCCKLQSTFSLSVINSVFSFGYSCAVKDVAR